MDAAQMTAPISLTGLPQALMASWAALTAISARIDSSSSPRAGRFGSIRSGSRTPDLSMTKRERMPEAVSMKASDEAVFSSASPMAMASACSAFQASAQAL
ncbi:hypothetical protein D9M68_977060 [compost metagenome]